MQYKNFTNRADLLEAAAQSIRMQNNAGIITPIFRFFESKLKSEIISATFTDKDYGYEFPLAVVEGKPVFEGDELYWNAEGRKIVAHSAHRLNECSWNPPKPKTVMVELPIELAEFMIDAYEYQSNKCKTKTEKVADACRKALDNIK